MTDPTQIQAMLQQAFASHGKGDLAKAEQLYRQILANHSRQPDALHYLGVIGLQLGRYQQAAELIGDAVKQQPNNLDALGNLGLAQQALGQSKHAIATYQRALELNPRAALVLANLGNVYAALGDVAKATEYYQQALSIDPNLAEARRCLADIMLMQGQPSEALRHIMHAEAVAPQAVEVQLSYANVLQELGKTDEALARYQHILEGHPRSVLVLCALAGVLRRLGRMSESIEHYQQALAVDPTHVEAHYGLGVAWRAAGDKQQALEHLRRAVALDPHCTKAWRTIATAIRCRPDSPELATMRRALREHDYPPERRMHLEYGLGKCFEDMGEHAQSIAHYHAANQLRRASFDYSISAEREHFENLKGAFDRAQFERWAGQGIDDATPIFIVGMPRSGTTLVEQILASHSTVFGAGELHWLTRAVADRWPLAGGIDYSAALATAGAEDLSYIGQRYLQRLREIAPDSRHVTDKLPNNFLHLGLIRLVLPKATIVHCARDPRDTCFSIYKHYFSARGHFYAYQMDELAAYYTMYADLMAHWRAVLPGPAIHEVQYEQLVADQEPETRALLAACGLDWEPACLQFHRTERPVSTISTAQVRRPMYRSSIGAWRAYAQALAPLFDALPSTAGGG